MLFLIHWCGSRENRSEGPLWFSDEMWALVENMTCCRFSGPLRAGKFQLFLRAREAERAMKRSKFSEAQNAFVLMQAEHGTSVGEARRKSGIIEATF